MAAVLPDLPGVVAVLRAGGCVFAEDEARLLIENCCGRTDLAALVERRVSGEPLEYVLGWASFAGRRIAVRPGVFVPRRRTGYLARCAAELACTGAVIADVCCGSGAVGAVLAATVDGCEMYAADIDPIAVRCARLNLPAARVFEGDLCSALPDDLRGRVDVLVANAPYVPTGQIGSMPREARCSEPRVALDGGVDGLDTHRRLAAEAPRWLAPGGSLLIETAEHQAPVAVDFMTRAGLAARVKSSAEFDATVVIGDRRRHRQSNGS